MDFTLSAEQQMIRDLCREFAENEIKPHAEEMDRSGAFPYDIVKKMGELGLLGLPFPEEYGGAGADFLAYWVARAESGSLVQTQPTAMVSLFACSLYIVQLMARTIVWWKVVLIASMAGLFVLCVVLPAGRKFFDLHFGSWYQWTTGLVIAAISCIALELLWRYLSAHSTAPATREA